MSFTLNSKTFKAVTMSAIRIRVGFNQVGYVYSVKILDTGAISTYSPGDSIPGIGVTPQTATTSARPVRAWLLSDKVEIENSDSSLIAVGYRGDYLIEGEYGELMIVKGLEVRSDYDLNGDVSRVYRNTPAIEFLGFDESVVGRMKNGNEF